MKILMQKYKITLKAWRMIFNKIQTILGRTKGIK
jgi:hypothetical protein